MFESFHPFGDDLPPLLQQPVEAPDLDAVFGDNPNPGFLARGEGDAFGGHRSGKSLRPIRPGPSGRDSLSDSPKDNPTPFHALPSVWGGHRARLRRREAVCSLQPVSHVLAAVLAHPAHGARMMAAERRGLPKLELDQAAGRLDLDLVEAGRQHLALVVDAADDGMDMAVPLAAPARLLVVDQGHGVIGCAQMLGHDLDGLPKLVPCHVP